MFDAIFGQPRPGFFLRASLRLQKQVLPNGGLDDYLSKLYDTKDKHSSLMLHFIQLVMRPNP